MTRALRGCAASAAALVSAALLPLDSVAMDSKESSTPRQFAGDSSSARSLDPCPSTPNCVSSLAKRGSQKIAPFALLRPADEVWRELKLVVTGMKRTTLVTDEPGYLHAECRSLVFRFVDDLELSVRDDGETVDVRSASRVGRSDLGVNRRRVERLRRALAEAGLVEKPPQR